ncbi:hypothetical protein [Streptomyces sp. CAI-85]|uniref:hypothetical protein n=1 Tax=Streptomyces sp. CAI-85 TaxID=1472662 RepID=UPI00158798CE|nr:hypothetical protein [Streptomyces sp. CAI-85]NUV60627.1 hypothetical protein [Streptomyces sp. CAI-85]
MRGPSPRQPALYQSADAWRRALPHVRRRKTQAKSAAVRRKVEGKARALLTELSVNPVGDALAQLRYLAGEVSSSQKATAALVNQLEHLRYQDCIGEQGWAEVPLYARAMGRAASILATMQSDERLAEVTQRQAGVVMSAIEASL